MQQQDRRLPPLVGRQVDGDEPVARGHEGREAAVEVPGLEMSVAVGSGADLRELRGTLLSPGAGGVDDGDGAGGAAAAAAPVVSPSARRASPADAWAGQRAARSHGGHGTCARPRRRAAADAALESSRAAAISGGPYPDGRAAPSRSVQEP